MAVQGELDFRVPSCLYLVSAFLAMESPQVLISFARDCGGGSITERVQTFIWDHCIPKVDDSPYLKKFLKKLIVEVESEDLLVLDELYVQLAFYMSSLKDDNAAKGNSRILKKISFLFPDDCSELPSCPNSRRLVVPLQCSLNMLEGDTGCSIWPSSLFLSEFILSCPEIFCNKSCFEVGSGVGLVGICLTHVKASKVVLSDGDMSSLANMKLNLELNHLNTGEDLSERTTQDSDLVKCIHLPWESSVESELQDFSPDIVLGADVIYDPSCLPHLVRVLAILLNPKRSHSRLLSDNCNVSKTVSQHMTGEANGADNSHGFDTCDEYARQNSKEGPVAYIASVIRNVDTFNHFLALAGEANLTVEDVTEKMKKPFSLLPYMQSYDRSSIRLFALTSYCCRL